MIAIALIGLFSGLLLGRRYRIFALVPVLLATAVLLTGLSVLCGISAASALLDYVVIAVGMQLGYLAMVIVGAPERASRSARPVITPF